MRRFSAPTDIVIAPIKQRLDEFREQRRVQAGSLIIFRLWRCHRAAWRTDLAGQPDPSA